MPLFSIIMPVYNAQQFLDDTILSVLKQDIRDFELLLINDGSTDNSLMIMEAFRLKDKRIVIHSINNSGPSAARNFGINISTGKYIMFLDSDDTLSADALSHISNILIDNHYDLLIYGFRLLDKTTNRVYIHNYNDVSLNLRTDLNALFGSLYRNNLLNQVWNKVYNASIIKDNSIRFSDYTYGEDRLFVFDYLPFCEKVRVVNRTLYNYNNHGVSSLISKYYDQKFKVCNLIDDKIHELQHHIGSFNSETLSDINFMYLKSVISCMTNIYHPSCNIKNNVKSSYLKEIITHDKVRKAVSCYTSHDIAMNIFVRIIKSKRVFLNRISAKFVSFSSIYLKGIFFKHKHPYAQKEHR